jgi:hypothetical protein
MLKGLPMTYNRDLQEDKEPLFDAVDTVKGCVEILCEMAGHLKFNREKMRKAAAGGFSTATDIAEYLVRKGVPFRDAHRVVVTVRVRNTAEVPPPGLKPSDRGGAADLPGSWGRDGVAPMFTQRGNRRQATFFCVEDYHAYLALLREWCGDWKVEIWAHCLMPNQVHLWLRSMIGRLLLRPWREKR